jgi:hypothetical protein
MREAPLTTDLQSVHLVLEARGFAVVPDLFSEAEIDSMCSLAASRLGDNSQAGDRGALRWTWVKEAARDSRIRAIVDSTLGEDSIAVRGILFDKQPGANWNLGYHQDRAVAFESRRETEGYIGWSEKDGVPHALAPAELLEQMLAVRISLDDCGPDNGPLRVLPGTHRDGLLSRTAVVHLQAVVEEEACVLDQGGAVLLKPLLLHASSAATSPNHRRVLHLEFAWPVLPTGLAFYRW